MDPQTPPEVRLLGVQTPTNPRCLEGFGRLGFLSALLETHDPFTHGNLRYPPPNTDPHKVFGRFWKTRVKLVDSVGIALSYVGPS